MRALVALIGLFRQFRDGLDSLHQNLFLPNPELSFDLALFTDPTQFCSAKDLAAGRCSCLEALTSVNRTARDVYRSRLVHLRLSGSPTSFYDRLVDARDNGLRQLFPGAHGRYAVLMILRPDAVLTRPLHIAAQCAGHRLTSARTPGLTALLRVWGARDRHGPRPALVRTSRYLASDAPGLNYLSGSFERPDKIHDRDYDLAFLFCDRESAPPFYDSLLLSGEVERGRCCDAPPPLPAGFHGRWSREECWEPFCRQLQLFSRARKRVGNLDHAHIFVELTRCAAIGVRTAAGMATVPLAY